MAFSQTEIDALKAAYAAGVLTVVHEGKRVEYGSESDLRRRIMVMEKALAVTSSQSNRQVHYMQFSRG